MANDGTVKIGVEVDEKEFQDGLSKLSKSAKASMNELGEGTERISDGLKDASANALTFGDVLKANPGLVASISQKWEALTAATIAAF